MKVSELIGLLNSFDDDIDVDIASFDEYFQRSGGHEVEQVAIVKSGDKWVVRIG